MKIYLGLEMQMHLEPYCCHLQQLGNIMGSDTRHGLQVGYVG